ncbi:hypothetical protein UFOVP330_73 [uncultured Caudovirales phage]|uniref:Uncharacterized protein n=1 Tax=uncultured Caudovirales phage TaxID=2100421 RepID=A0A6J5M3M4_9CAUD|nr:hypothetical protein UFOVP330_73 [uncultured Caudovirales phage]
MKTVGKLKPAPIKGAGKTSAKSAEAYDAKMAELDFPGTKGMALPAPGKQKVSGFKFSGTY